MLRLTLLLCIGMFAALMIAGEDRGQMRPGLAAAAAKKAAPEAETQAVSTTAVVEAPAETVEPVVETAAAAPEVAEPVVETAVAVPEEPVAEAGDPAPALAAAEPETTPEPYVEPVRELVSELEEPVFSLSSVGNEPVPGAPVENATTPEVPAGGEGTIWYVNASSVNVRAEPSTDAEVLGKLAQGEATLVVQAVDADWARIVIQGDGVEGFVALRYLSAEAP